eukprot:GAHX01001998.1.p1 GENE.GAHX01001998.1~~GAHX01001998.1.p1  ORF type:complete len:166 (-),score=33.77 GAHX01001998.1:82-579(-)
MQTSPFSSEAISQLTKYVKEKENSLQPKTLDRRSNPSFCTDLAFAERFRLELSEEISQRVMNIFNKSLTEEELTQQNIEINKLVKEKLNWETKIVDLAGPDYKDASSKIRSELIKQNKLEQINFVVNKETGKVEYYYFGDSKNMEGIKDKIKRNIKERREYLNLT